MIYIANSIDQKYFIIKNADEQEVASLQYDYWYSIKATIKTNDAGYTIKPKNILETAIYVMQNENIILEFKMNFKGDILLKDIKHGHQYKIKSKGIVNYKLHLFDENDNQLAEITPDFVKKTFNFNYQIQTNDHFETLPNKDLLIPLLIHCSNYVIDIYILMLASAH